MREEGEKWNFSSSTRDLKTLRNCTGTRVQSHGNLHDSIESEVSRKILRRGGGKIGCSRGVTMLDDG